MPHVTEIDPIHPSSDENLFQSAFWAHFKQYCGCTTQAFHVKYDSAEADIFLVNRSCTPSDGYGYVPYGPDIALPPEQQGPFLESLSEQLGPYLPDSCRFIRYDLPWPSPYAPENDHAEWSGPPEPRIREMRMNFGSRYWNLRKAPTDMQPPDTVILNLNQSEQELLAGMHPKTRYGIRSSFRKGVVVSRGGTDMLEIWHNVYSDMAVRKDITAESVAYFHKLFTAARCHDPDIELYLAWMDGQLLAGSIIANDGTAAYYLYSAASPMGRKLMASYAILWDAIREAKRRKCRKFDFYGIPPNNSPAHPMQGLYRFKTRFGGRILHMRGCWDYPFDEEQYPFLAQMAGSK